MNTIHCRSKEPLSWPVRALNLFEPSEKGSLMCLVSEPLAGQTNFALMCAWRWGEHSKVLYITADVSLRGCFLRLQSFAGCDSNAFRSNNLLIAPISSVSSDGIDALISAYDPDVVVIDFLRLHGGEQDATDLALYLRRLADSGKAVLALMKSKKESGVGMISGDASRILKMADLIAELKSDRIDVIHDLRFDKRSTLRLPERWRA